MTDTVKRLEHTLELLGEYTLTCLPLPEQFKFHDDVRAIIEENDALLRKAADQAREIERLRKLDAEYGRVELAIIMADQDFDGDSDHANCGDRLVASVERFSEQIAAKNSEIDRLHRLIVDLTISLDQNLDDDACWTDHHGYCQAHQLDDVNFGGCRVENGRRLVKNTKAEFTENDAENALKGGA